MEKMNLFDRKGESSEALFGDTKLKKSTALPPAPIQDKDGNLTFELEGKTYSLNVNSEEERERVKEEINANASDKYEWFKEYTGLRHWVLFNTEIFKIKQVSVYWVTHLHYREDNNLVPIMPINATSCHFMFAHSLRLTQPDFSKFNTCNITCMESMFQDNENITQLDLSGFDTSKVIDMCSMFRECVNLMQLNLSSFNTDKVSNMHLMFFCCNSLVELDLSSFNVCNTITMIEMFGFCRKLANIYISNKWDASKVTFTHKTFEACYSLPNFNEEKTNVEMAKPVEQGGYLILKN